MRKQFNRRTCRFNRLSPFGGRRVERKSNTARKVFFTVIAAVAFALIVCALQGCGLRIVRDNAGKAPQISIAPDGSIKPSPAFLREYENFLVHTERAAAQQEKERNHLLAQIPVTHYYDAQRRLMLVRPPVVSGAPSPGASATTPATAPAPASPASATDSPSAPEPAK